MRRHDLDVISLVAGVAFAALGALLVADQVDLVVRLRWGWPLLLIAVAVIMLASVVANRGVASAAQRDAAPIPSTGATWAGLGETSGEAPATPSAAQDEEGRERR